jgi:hypothetical protein
MADKKTDDGFTHESFKDDGFGIGQKADGKLDTFPLSELAAKLKERDEQEGILAGAMAELDGEEDDLREAYEETDAPEDDE